MYLLSELPARLMQEQLKESARGSRSVLSQQPASSKRKSQLTAPSATIGFAPRKPDCLSSAASFLTFILPIRPRRLDTMNASWDCGRLDDPLTAPAAVLVCKDAVQHDSLRLPPVDHGCLCWQSLLCNVYGSVAQESYKWTAAPAGDFTNLRLLDECLLHPNGLNHQTLVESFGGVVVVCNERSACDSGEIQCYVSGVSYGIS